jgi:hypothetical protein
LGEKNLARKYLTGMDRISRIKRKQFFCFYPDNLGPSLFDLVVHLLFRFGLPSGIR